MPIPGEKTDQSVIWVAGDTYGRNHLGQAAVAPSGSDATASPDSVNSVTSAVAALRAKLSASGVLQF